MSRTLPDTGQDAPPEINTDDLQDGDRVVIRATRFGGGRQIRIVGTARPDHERPEFVVEETDPDWTWLLDEAGKLYVHEGGPWRRLVADDWSLHRVPATDGGTHVPLQSVRVQCPECGATHCRPLRVDPEDPPETIENECIPHHPMRDAGFAGCGETLDLVVVDVEEVGSR
jgi:hypothetical protein